MRKLWQTGSNGFSVGHNRGVEAEIPALDGAVSERRELIAKLYYSPERFDLSAMMRNLEDV
ncbi:MAG: hypothetical protein ABWZ75_04735 [Novosphingobium sp.]